MKRIGVGLASALFIFVAASGNVGAAAIADLSMTLVTSPSPVRAGSQVTYSAFVDNMGPNAATLVELSDLLPPNTTFVSISEPSGWNCTTPLAGQTGAIGCITETLDANDFATISFVLLVAGTVADGSTLSNTLLADSVTSDPNASNNTLTSHDMVIHSIFENGFENP